MITLPSQSIGEVEVFPDDHDATRFYAVLTRPTVATEAGEPLVSLVKYRSQGPRGELGRSGGILNIDLSLAPTEAQLDEVRRTLAESGPDDVEIAAPSWVEAVVTLEMPDGDGLMQAVASAFVPSALAADRAVLSAQLAPAGATLLGNLIRDGGNALQARWTVTFDARLPDVEVVATAELSRVHMQIRTLATGSGPWNRSTLQATGWRDIAVQSGALTVRTEGGPDGIPSWFTEYVLDRLEELVIPALFDQDAEAWTLLDEPPDDQVTLRLQASSIGRWTVSAVGALELPPLPEAVQEIDLEPAFRVYSVGLRVLADFESGGAVEVELEYSGTDDGEARTETRSFVFDSDRTERWEPLAMSDGVMRYRYRALAVGADLDWSDWHATTDRFLTVYVPDLAPVQVRVIDANVPWDLVRSVTVELAWEGPDGPGLAMVVLESDQREVAVSLGMRPSGVRHRWITRLEDGSTIEGDWTELQGQFVLVTDPVAGRVLNVQIVGVGMGWKEVQQVVVDLRHHDPAREGHPVDYTRQNTVMMRPDNPIASWRVVLREGGPRTYSYRWTAILQSGGVDQHDWIDVEDSGVAVVALVPPPAMRVQVLVVGVDSDVHAMVVVRLEAVSDELELPGGLLTFTEDGEQTWSEEVPEGAEIPQRYRWTAEWFDTEGGKREQSGEDTAEILVVVPPRD